MPHDGQDASQLLQGVPATANACPLGLPLLPREHGTLLCTTELGGPSSCTPAGGTPVVLVFLAQGSRRLVEGLALAVLRRRHVRQRRSVNRYGSLVGEVPNLLSRAAHILRGFGCQACCNTTVEYVSGLGRSTDWPIHQMNRVQLAHANYKAIMQPRAVQTATLLSPRLIASRKCVCMLSISLMTSSTASDILETSSRGQSSGTAFRACWTAQQSCTCVCLSISP